MNLHFQCPDCKMVWTTAENYVICNCRFKSWNLAYVRWIYIAERFNFNKPYPIYVSAGKPGKEAIMCVPEDAAEMLQRCLSKSN